MIDVEKFADTYDAMTNEEKATLNAWLTSYEVYRLCNGNYDYIIVRSSDSLDLMNKYNAKRVSEEIEFSIINDYMKSTGWPKRDNGYDSQYDYSKGRINKRSSMIYVKKKSVKEVS